MKIFRTVLVAGLAFLLILGLLLQLFHFPFSAIEQGRGWTTFAYYITQSAGVAGTSLLVCFACFLYTLREEGFHAKFMVFAKSLAGLSAVIGLFAFVNEHFTKPLWHLPRPSHEYMLSRFPVAENLDSLYSLTREQRFIFFDKSVHSNASRFSLIDSRVLNHWIEEAGYSFPSGHTFNAFLLAMIFAFGIRGNLPFPRLRFMFVIPFVWAVLVAVSRVSLGAHSTRDVLAGAFMGIGLGAALLYLDATRHWITHKKDLL